MKSFKSNHPSNFSTRTLPFYSDKSRRKLSSASSLSESSTSSTNENTKSSKKMKLLISVGIALPVLAAVIGVVSWALSADSIHQRPTTSKLQSSDLELGSYEDNYIDLLENRNDLDQSPNNLYTTYSKDNLPPDLNNVDHPNFMEDEDMNQHSISGSEEAKPDDKKDPLYIVHFVPSHAPTMDTITLSPTEDKISKVNQKDSQQAILDKILEASKGTKPGIPQFVVFAPMPDSRGQTTTNKQPTTEASIDLNSSPSNIEPFDYLYEDLEGSSKSNPQKEMSRVGIPDDRKGHSFQTSFRTTVHNTSTGQQFTNLNGGVIQSPPVQPQPLQHQSQPAQPLQHQPQPIYAPHPPYYAPVQQQQQPHHYEYEQSPSTPHGIHQPVATGRSGQIGPLGIKLSLGNGGHHGGHGLTLGGGGFSPLGIMATLLKPALPRFQSNVNGKMMFGVMLENGLKLGGPKHHEHHHGHVFG